MDALEELMTPFPPSWGWPPERMGALLTLEGFAGVEPTVRAIVYAAQIMPRIIVLLGDGEN